MSPKRINQARVHAATCRAHAAAEDRDATYWRHLDRGRGSYADEIRMAEARRDGWMEHASKWDAEAQEVSA